ncbi:MAG: hypothetical protein AAF561_03175 [Planctomycetota bacterium]
MDEEPTMPQESATGDNRSFAASLAGGDGDYVMPEDDKPKFSRTGIAFVGMGALALGGLFLMQQRAGGPASAAAAEGDVAPVDRQSIQTFLEGGAKQVREVEALLADSEAIKGRFGELSRDKQVPLESLKTNPFWRVIEDDEADEVDEAAVSEAYARRLAAERDRLRQEAAEDLEEDVAGLSVGTVMLGARPTCQIDGQFLKVGDTVEGMTVVAIARDGITLRRGDHTAVARIGR